MKNLVSLLEASMTFDQFLKGLSFVNPSTIKNGIAEPVGKMSIFINGKTRDIEAFQILGSEGSYSFQVISEDGEKAFELLNFEILSSQNQKRIEKFVDEMV